MFFLPLRWAHVRRALLISLLVGMVLTATIADAQNHDFHARIGNSVAVLTGPWKFHAGDNPAWAASDLDDSGWGELDLTPPEQSFDPITGASGFVPGWTARGFPHLTGYAWYRLRVNVENDTALGQPNALALTMPMNFDDAYEVFVNGRRIGQFGEFSGKTVNYYNSQPRSFALSSNTASGPITIAIRMWMDKGTALLSTDAGGLHGPPMLGNAVSINAMLRLEWDAVNRTQIGNLLSSSLSLLAAILGLVLFWLDRREKTYLWLALACLSAFLARCTVLLGYYTLAEPMVPETFFQDVVLTPLNLALWAMFWAYWFRIEAISRVMRIAMVLFCAQALGTALVRPPLYGTLIPPSASSWMVPIAMTMKLAMGALLVWITYRGIRKRAIGGWLALAPILLMIIWAYQEELALFHVPVIVPVGGLTFNIGQIANVGMLAIVSVLLMHRFVQGQREQEHLRVEIEQARQVQQVLIPEALPSIPGFALASEYRPAQQVGGDFFQIMPLENGGVLAVIGDVSGKGMPAAMTVSLLVGTVRTLAHFTTRPGEILAAMNIRMLSRMQGGFTTCMVVRVDAQGGLVIANAGHLAPYIEGRELKTEAGLPLGLTADTRYPETEFRLEVGQQFTMLTDGVVESRNASGELLGFDRTAAMAMKGAESIARKAQEFGQDDDITVLTVKRLARGEEPAMRLASSVIVADLA
jgi:hypothetical protein